MRWEVCHICGAEQDTFRDEVNYKDKVVMYECSDCYEEYCDKCGSTKQLPLLCNKCKQKKENQIVRNPERIKPMLDKLKELWYKHPDLRFGQLVTILGSQMDIDSFYAEEDKWIEIIEDMKEIGW